MNSGLVQGTYYQFTDWVWGVLEEYAFGAIERIINFFATEEMQERLAKIILNDPGLQEDLNLDTPDNPDYKPDEGLKYLAVAKVGVLAIADYIHDKYIGSTGAKAQLWYEFMGDTTLVDLVGQALSAIASTLTAVKNAATAALNAVKSGLSFISESAFRLIMTGFSVVSNLFLKSLFFMADAMINGLDFDLSGSIPKINTQTGYKEFGSDFSNDEFKFYFGSDNYLMISDIFGGFEIEFETLGVNSEQFLTYSTVAIIGELSQVLTAALFGTLVKNPATYKDAIIIQLAGLALAAVFKGPAWDMADDTSIDPLTRRVTLEFISKYHLSAALTSLFYGFGDYLANLKGGLFTAALLGFLEEYVVKSLFSILFNAIFNQTPIMSENYESFAHGLGVTIPLMQLLAITNLGSITEYITILTNEAKLALTAASDGVTEGRSASRASKDHLKQSVSDVIESDETIARDVQTFSKKQLFGFALNNFVYHLLLSFIFGNLATGIVVSNGE